MAPWHDRPGPRRPSDQGVAIPRPGATPARLANTSRMMDLGALDSSQIQGSSSSSDEQLHPPSRPHNRPTHGRSMSNPFPSLFSGRKKKPGRPAVPLSDSDSSDQEVPMSGPRGRPQPRPRGHTPSSSRDFASGHCMTCDSLVRWPRELPAFKCTVCLTINDVQPPPSAHDERRDRDWDRDRLHVAKPLPPLPTEKAPAPAAPSAPSHPPPPPPTAAAPISLDRTKAIISQCLAAYLDAALVESTVDPAADACPGPSARVTRLTNDPARPSIGTPGLRLEQPSGAPFRLDSSRLSPPNNVPRHFLNRPDHPHDFPRRNNPMSRSYSTSYPERSPIFQDASLRSTPDDSTDTASSSDSSRRIFKQLESYLVGSLTSFLSLDASFVTAGPGGHEPGRRRPSEPYRERRDRRDHRDPRDQNHQKDPATGDHPVPDLDPKLLLLGNVAENGSWWTGSSREGVPPTRTLSQSSDTGPVVVSQRSPRIDWAELDEWYAAVINCGQTWTSVYDGLVRENPFLEAADATLRELEVQILAAQAHVQRTLLKATEMILKRPGRRISRPSDLRFLLIILANPLFRPSYRPFAGRLGHSDPSLGNGSYGPPSAPHSTSGRHSNIVKRLLGLIAHAPNDCHSHLVSWFARYSTAQFIRTKDLVGSFLSYRLARQSNNKQPDVRVDVIDNLIPSMPAGHSAASLHAALGHPSGANKKPREAPKALYHDNWQITATAQVMALIFAANNSVYPRRSLAGTPPAVCNDSVGFIARDGIHARGQLLPTSDFYTTLLDNSDLVAEFEAWENKSGRFSFCQYPFLLSIWAKIQILEYDARRQMQSRARDAFFDSIMSRRSVEQYLVLNVRRDCLVEDSLRAVSEAIGMGGEDIKKGLRIAFRGEEGVDAGGLRKEWFLLLVREVFNPEHGMFVYDEDSQYCYFNPNSFETSDQFFLVGVVFGLAIYNSTILDIALPPFAFRKLMMAAPAAATMPPSQAKAMMTYTLDDLAEYRPRLARGLRQLLDYEGDVENIFCLDFVVDIEKYGAIDRVPLCPGGERRPVTSANRREYVDLYVRFLLDAAVSRQFEPFKRGFFTVCGGNALSLFRPEEIELLVRGSDEPLDIASLRAVADYENWGRGGKGKGKDPAETEDVVRWFWSTFESAPPADQRRLLLFITGSDRIPAMGAASLSIRITCHGDDCGRFPTAHTCFNVLALYRYKTRARLETMLWTAVRESEGFGLK